MKPDRMFFHLDQKNFCLSSQTWDSLCKVATAHRWLLYPLPLASPIIFTLPYSEIWGEYECKSTAAHSMWVFMRATDARVWHVHTWLNMRWFTKSRFYANVTDLQMLTNSSETFTLFTQFINSKFKFLNIHIKE